MREPPAGARLDSWKAIADYLQRDVATARRWEKNLGLPVHRVAGSGRSVFADTSEIDDWLRRSKPAPSPAPRVFRLRWLAAAAAATIVVVVAAVLAQREAISGAGLRVEVVGQSIVARDPGGTERWRYDFPATHDTVLPRDPLLVTGGKNPVVYLATSYSGRQKEAQIEDGSLALFGTDGRRQRSFSFDDDVTFGGKSFAGPWGITSFAVDETRSPHRVAVAAHDYMWDPGIVTVLDENWKRRGTFVHAGWIEVVRWMASGQLLVGGFSNAHDGGMVALLDPDNLDGQGPEPANSRHHCSNCGTAKPLRMVVLPRSEVNRAGVGRFNRVIVQSWLDRVVVQTVEMSSDAGDATAVYEFTPALELRSATFNDRYWQWHSELEAAGKIAHTREQCPDRAGPPALTRWESTEVGWQTVAIER